MPTAETLTIREPDDWHLHLRDDAMLALTADYSARQFARAIICLLYTSDAADE